MTALTQSRRHDLDWLRVAAFAVLIFYHIGMFYVTWGWHVKSSHAGPDAELPMMLVNAWRLSLLFFISGVALRYAVEKGPRLVFAGKRFARLAGPIFFGMAVVVAPQAYFELLSKGVIGPGFLSFYPDYLSFDQKFPIVTPTWNHLWYVVYLLVYSMIAIAAAPLLLRAGEALAKARGSGLAVLLLAPLPFIVYRFTLTPSFPTTHALVDDWANHAHSFSIFLLGFLVARSERFWSAVRKALPAAIAFVMLCVVLFSWAWRGDVWPRLEQDAVLLNGLRALRIVYGWMVIVALAGLGMRFLNRDSQALRYLTQAVFCWYILHQTMIVVAGYHLAGLGLPAGVEFALLTAATFGGCAFGYEIVRRIPVLRYALGVSGGPPRRLAKTAPVAVVKG